MEAPALIDRTEAIAEFTHAILPHVRLRCGLA
jgi:hypothetical protein